MFSGLSDELARDLIRYALNSPKGRRRWHISRLYMYKHLENFLEEEDAASRTALSISHSANLAELVGVPSVAISEANYPEHDATDLSAFGDESFDFVFADQVLEHVAGDPFTVFSECHRVLKPGGFVVQTTCFFQFIHQHPIDFWRFTPNALSLLCERNGLDVRRVGGWGNRESWTYMNMGFRSEKVPEDPENPIYQLAMRSDKKYPLTTWVIGQRPVDGAPGAAAETGADAT
jgi:SAM-dependent methyltransferase